MRAGRSKLTPVFVGWRGRDTRIVAVLLIASLVMACSGRVGSFAPTGSMATGRQGHTVASTPVEPRVDSITTVTDWRQISLPLDAYVQDFTEQQTILRAEYSLTKSCVEQFGFQFAAPAWDKSAADVPNGEHPAHYRLYGLLDVDHAKQMGYHSYGQTVASEAAYADMKLPNDYYNVVAAKFGGGTFNGKVIPVGGCLGAAQREVEGATDLSLPQQLAFDSWTASTSDSRVVAGFASWSKCMAQSGYNYSAPMEANNDPKWSGDKASAEEIAVAVADVNCKKATNLVGIRMAVDAAYQRKAIGQHGAELNALKAVLVRQAATASAILADR
jgi:hypothetical protein